MKEFPVKHRLWRPGGILALWFGAGLAPKAPGTFGSLAALPFGLAAAYWGGPYAVLALAAVIFLIGIRETGRYISNGGNHDPGEVVIDEVAGQLMPLAFIPIGFLPYLAAFILFRAADILKPWPCSLIDRTSTSAFGVMADDIVAGLYAILGVLALDYVGVW
jgi:phosphatidylglycerophosphatase A